MKILWVKTDFLHPPTRGGRIRSLEILRRLHLRHEIHYVAFESADQPEGPLRSSEYCTRSYPVSHRVPGRNSIAFLGQLVSGLFSPLPLAVSRYRSVAMKRLIEELLSRERFDRVVCDFLVPAPSLPSISSCVLFQHNVETSIWQRHARHAADPLRKLYFGLQARRMFRFERRICRSAGHIVAVSGNDAELMKTLFGVRRLSVAPTGVDVCYFSPPPESPRVADLVFVGSMDWLPNVDGVLHFVREILPRIRVRRPSCSVAIVGRSPTKEIASLAGQDPQIFVTGTVDDIRPFLWGSSVSIVPLRIGGGTRLKIYEAMAARVPVVSSSVGAEGLDVSSPENILIADTPGHFTERCLELLDNPGERSRIADAAWGLVTSRFSWDHVADCFEQILKSSSAGTGFDHPGDRPDG